MLFRNEKLDLHNFRSKQKSVKSFRLLALTVLKCIAPQNRRNIEKWEEYGTRCKSENFLPYWQKFNERGPLFTPIYTKARNYLEISKEM